MLKIRDGVNLEELEKYGFKPKYDTDTGKVTEYYRINGNKKGTTISMSENFSEERKYKNFWHINVHDRKIYDHGYVSLTNDDYEILYDLIKANLVVKE